ncbi:hypothetical protein [Nocardioides sp.]|uniref:hypothetical protein n=1 Tax=Nocardioides sp. TaxID=35761 RepID=UPI00356AB4B9
MEMTTDELDPCPRCGRERYVVAEDDPLCSRCRAVDRLGEEATAELEQRIEAFQQRDKQIEDAAYALAGLLDDRDALATAAEHLALSLIHAFDYDWGLLDFMESMEIQRQDYRTDYKQWFGEDVPAA